MCDASSSCVLELNIVPAVHSAYDLEYFELLGDGGASFHSFIRMLCEEPPSLSNSRGLA